jgi:hypothetical protein
MRRAKAQKEHRTVPQNRDEGTTESQRIRVRRKRVVSTKADGLTILPKLVHSLAEARHNLAVLYMRNNNPTEANVVLPDYQPIELHESILRATGLLALGQLSSEASRIEEANAIFSDYSKGCSNGGLTDVIERIT